MRTFALALGASVVLLSASASAHFKMVMPPSPTNSADGKGPPPCGPDIGEGTVTPVTGGSMIPLSVNENVRHGGFYRVALALKSCKGPDVEGMPKCFPADNKVYDKANKLLNPTGPGDSDHADIDPAPKFPILADGMFKHTQDADGTGPAYAGMISIPNINCEKCTLQVIEFMAPHGPNGSAGYFYHHCSDLKITADPGKPIFDPGGAGGSGGAGGTGAGGAAGAAGVAGTGGAAGSMSAAGTTSTTAGTTSSTGGAPAGAGSPGTSGTTTSVGTSGSGTASVTGGAAPDDGGCGIAKRTQGGASLVAALGLLFALGRRRRNR